MNKWDIRSWPKWLLLLAGWVGVYNLGYYLARHNLGGEFVCAVLGAAIIIALWRL